MPIVPSWFEWCARAEQMVRNDAGRAVERCGAHLKTFEQATLNQCTVDTTYNQCLFVARHLPWCERAQRRDNGAHFSAALFGLWSCKSLLPSIGSRCRRTITTETARCTCSTPSWRPSGSSSCRSRRTATNAAWRRRSAGARRQLSEDGYAVACRGEKGNIEERRQSN